MNDIIKTLHEKALGLDACEKFSGKETEKELIELFFSPQGMEFCGKNKFPSIEDFRYFSKESARKQGMYVNAGNISVENKAHVAVVGNTEAQLTYSDGSKRHIVVLMHGAKAHITATDFAVVFVYNFGGEVTKETKDFAKIL
ncbi:MAG: hypothetical protein NC308_09675 [Clostridium sp.]|nr:hypothetical protein [Bacteroides sp.]MCM1199146.1 hypothetical protein [Clostridium sp.]